MNRQWLFTLTRRVLDEPTRTTQHTYTVDSPQALELLVQRASKDRDVVAYEFERVLDEQYRWRPCDCHGHLAKGNQNHAELHLTQQLRRLDEQVGTQVTVLDD
jgi:hypothetical protein